MPVTDAEVYNPSYDDGPFTDFASIGPETPLAQLNLNWREQDLPERQRTKHVHRLHPYLGKFIPQLVEIFLRKFAPKVVCDPFCGSGTTLVEANALGIASIGCDISPFNCLISKVKTDKYDIAKLEQEIHNILHRSNHILGDPLFSSRNSGDEIYQNNSEYLSKWLAPQALKELLCFRSFIKDYEYQDVLKLILSRSARSARLTTHYDLDFPKKPQTQPYHCYKHGRICRPVETAMKFLNRYSLDTLKRIKEFSETRKEDHTTILCGDAREVTFPKHDMVMTSPPYVGLIDYHEQHRYAYELLHLDDSGEQSEIGPAAKGQSQKARKEYIDEIGKVLLNVSKNLKKNGIAVIVVNDKQGLYNSLASKLNFELEQKVERHVNRRTGRRATNFYEEILIWRKKA